MIQDAIRKLIDGRDLSRAEMQDVFGGMMDGDGTDVQKTALLVTLRMKGETCDELTGAAIAMRQRVTPLQVETGTIVDTCGTGGDGRGTFNISTVSALVAAGAGATVAKHGNRAVSSQCGSADVLAALGVNIELDAGESAEVLRRAGISFLFAPRLHPAMRAVVTVRRELGVRTLFNILGPLTNPALARRQVLGVFAPHLVPVVAEVLLALGAEHAMVVHSDDGLDEISVSAPTTVAEVRDGRVRRYVVTPEDLGLRRYPGDLIAGGDAQTNAAIIESILAGEAGAGSDVVAANAGAALYVAGIAPTIRDGVTLAQESIRGGAAMRKLADLVRVSQEVGKAA